MSERNIYPSNIGGLVKRKHLIPRRLLHKEHLKQYKKYWVQEQYIKIEDVYTIEGNEYYCVQFPQDMFGQLSYPINSENSYELNADYKKIRELDCIINTNKSYPGAEIKYWFHIKNIDLSSDQYKEFWSFLNPCSKNLISDDKFYFLYGSIAQGRYYDCRICLDKNKSKRRRKRKKK